jgi:hypothetical protein
MIKGYMTIKCSDCGTKVIENIIYVEPSMQNIVDAINRKSKIQFVLTREFNDEGCLSGSPRLHCFSCYNRLIRKKEGVVE